MSQELFDTPRQRAQFDQAKAEARQSVQVLLTEYQKGIAEGLSPDEAMVATHHLLEEFIRETRGDVTKYLAMAVRIMDEKGVTL